MMVHLPMAFLDQPPARGLVLCFGMGTSFRSMLSWGVPTTAVELVPSVPGLFGYYNPGQESLLHSPLATVVIDDARRFLERSRESFSVIVIDPPPPVEAAGSSLLYSKEFYAGARKRLAPGGILAQWFPGGEPVMITAITRALLESFPYVRAFNSVEGWGLHLLASDQPIPERDASEMLARMPAQAVRDLMEWGPMANPLQQIQVTLNSEISIQVLLAASYNTPALCDDRPVNEYYFLRRHRQ
jgi:spermidine synthase